MSEGRMLSENATMLKSLCGSLDFSLGFIVSEPVESVHKIVVKLWRKLGFEELWEGGGGFAVVVLSSRCDGNKNIRQFILGRKDSVELILNNIADWFQIIVVSQHYNVILSARHPGLLLLEVMSTCLVSLEMCTAVFAIWSSSS